MSIHTLRDFLAGYGLECEIHHPPDKPKRPSLLATYGIGEGGPRVMLGPGHVDVVPANPEIWTQDPWAGKVVDGKVRRWMGGSSRFGSVEVWMCVQSSVRPPVRPDIHQTPPTQIYGRGSVDMLCTVAAHAVVFARIAKARVPLKGTLLFCAVSDEEAGGKDGAGCVFVFW